MNAMTEHLRQWPIEGPFAVAPVPRSENLVFRVVDGKGGRWVLRLHRPGYHDAREVQSELDWIAAIERDTGVQVPEIVATRDGGAIAPVNLSGEASPRLAVLFKEHPGELPGETDARLPDIFEALGAAAAQCHVHVRTWRKPKGFTRPYWTIATTLGPNGIWGDWRATPGLSLKDTALLTEAELRLHALFNAYGTKAARFGLIHNDMRPSNFLWHEDKLRLLDFDDCGFGWFIADFAAAVSWFEDDPRVPDLFARWQAGYARHRTLSAQDIAMAGPALLARRMLLLAWTGSRAETDLAAAHARGLVEGTVGMARRFLGGETLV